MSDLTLRGLHKAFGDHVVLRGVDLSVKNGSLLALLGPSGSGKTTLLRTVCGFERASQGTIEIGGRQVESDEIYVRAEARRIGYVSQEGSLFPHLSVAENIVFGLPSQQRRARHRVDELLELVGLPLSCGDRPPHQLSGGQQQRVALARALAPSPSLVMLDEPFSSLDASLRAETRQAVADALAHAGATAVLVTHDQSEALSMGHEVAVLWDGRLIQIAAPDVLYRRPVSREVASFVGEALMLAGVAEQGSARCDLGRLKLSDPHASGPVDVMIRPEQIQVAVEDRDRSELAEDNRCTAYVEAVTFYGHDARLNLRLEAAPASALAGGLAVYARVPGYRAPAVGTRVRLSVDGEVVAYPH
ncbi:ABC transporter ATP-binding protein [Trinickia dinghuensis]|uniref:ABC transporter ATP-binding protein n=1 Tax=Trinickia dinghuensis TaxID=2291023 RepID=A0A3D8JVL6_9BURK|nr:ABC transporter ATP-binding protein [Trinickia dinghuensis]RDU96842.1 ABC transporter ATP-binding protein [Trinickia dinghuensis]